MKRIASEVAHLVRRFFLSLSRRPPSQVDTTWARNYLLDREFVLWSQMSNQDRRHSIMVARRFVEEGPDGLRDHVAAALLHDIGKIEAGLGVMGRVAATVLGPRCRKFRLYRDHEQIGLRLCREHGSTEETLRVLDWSLDDPIVVSLRRADQI